MNTANLFVFNANKVICEVIECDEEATSEVILRLESNELIGICLFAKNQTKIHLL